MRKVFLRYILYLFLSYVYKEGNIPYHHIFWSASSLYISHKVIYSMHQGLPIFSARPKLIYKTLCVKWFSLFKYKKVNSPWKSQLFFFNFYRSTKTSSMKGAVPKSFVTKQARNATVMWHFSISPWLIKSSVACSDSGPSLVHRSSRGVLAGDGRENPCRRILVDTRGEWKRSGGRRQ